MLKMILMEFGRHLKKRAAVDVRGNFRIIIIASIIGIVVGVVILGVELMIHEGIHFVGHFLDKISSGNSLLRACYQGILLIFGVIPVFLIITYWHPDSAGEGIGRTIKVYGKPEEHNRPFTYYLNLAMAKIVNTFITITVGGSCGMEAPFAMIGERIGSCISRIARVVNLMEFKTYQACSVATAFTILLRSPWAGAALACDMLVPGWNADLNNCIYALISALWAWGILSLFGYNTPIFVMNQTEIEYNFSLIMALIFSAIVITIISWFYVNLLHFTEHKFNNEKFHIRPGLDRFYKILIGFSLVAIIGIINFKNPNAVLGIGEEVILEAINGKILYGTAIIILLSKLFAVTFTLSPGGSGGNLTPALFIGAVSGCMMADLMGMPYPPFIVVGIAAALNTVVDVYFATPICIGQFFGSSYITVSLIGLLVSFFGTSGVSIFENSNEDK